ncbi:MAG: hypothetical protein K0R94_228 [Burkholderiales bacterium]|nr:hypothetical protein [Burkholderiales bacterium]
MTLNKIIIGLAAIGLSTCVLANVGDGANSQQITRNVQVGANPVVTAAVTFRVCNFSTTDATWDARPDNTEDLLVMNDEVTVNPNKCQILALRVNADNKKLPSFTVTSNIQGQTSSFHVSGILNLDNKVTKEMKIDSYAPASGNKLSIYAYYKTENGNEEKPLDAAVDKLTQNLSGGVVPDFVLCNNSDGTGNQCNDYSSKR